ncbi:MAG: alpha/beta hydrolase-fold protein [bacterium]
MIFIGKRFYTRQSLIIVSVFAVLLAFSLKSNAAEPLEKSFFSEALGAEKAYRIALPPDYDENPEKRYPVVYLLHGYNFVRNREDYFESKASEQEEQNHWPVQEQAGQVTHCLFTMANFDELLKCLTEKEVEYPEAVVNALKGQYPNVVLPLPPMIIVMPDGDSSFYINRADGKKQKPPLDGPEFVGGIRNGATGQYETYIVRDLVAHIDETYRTIADRDRRGVGGFSMGGIGSMNLLLGNPDVFSSVTSLSAVYTLTKYFSDPISLSGMKTAAPELIELVAENPESNVPRLNEEFMKKFDPSQRLKNLEQTDVHIYYDAGEKDYFSGWRNFESFEKFDKMLEKKGLISHPENHVIPGTEINGKGMHKPAYWRSRLGVMLAFHAKVFGLIQ